MNPKNYSSCELPDHDSEFLNMVCTNHQCKKNRKLLCSHCQLNHQECIKISLRKFTQIYQDQINPYNLESLKKQYNDLNKHFNQIEETLDYSYKFFNDKLNQIKTSINHVKKQIYSNQSDTSKQKQFLNLQQFELEPSIENFNNLLADIESFKPNSDKIPFKVKNIGPPKFLNEDINNMEIIVSKFQKAAQTITEQYRNLFDTFQKNIKNLFPNILIEQLSNNSNKFKMIKIFKFQVINSKQINQLLNQFIKMNNFFKLNMQLFRNVYKASIQNNNSLENDIVLEVNDEKQFNFKLEGSEITKMLLINENIIFGIGGTKFYIFDVSSQQAKNENVQSILTISEDAGFIDLAYFRLDEQNGYIYLATKKGSILKFLAEGKKNIKIKQDQMQPKIIDQPGMLQILISEEGDKLYSIGEEMKVKIWSLNNMEFIKSLLLEENATAFHMDWKILFIGGKNSITIWDQITLKNENLVVSKQKVKKILTNTSKLFLGLEDYIKIYTFTNQRKLEFFTNIPCQKINLIQTIKTYSILVISYTFKQEEKVCLYDYEDELPPKELLEQSAQCCSVYEQNKVNYLAFIQKTGICVTFKMEQKYQLAQ
ncbi:unnamed protein product [Paramecium primaurelia]|uniref:WD40-repeat-containing domain n=1 Tax=Paramecium primaurelia TaxID=5886 RepID=A0A8S1Q6P5_PARPR|nr:unnamed protein product [Paramecium primaurelia]